MSSFGKDYLRQPKEIDRTICRTGLAMHIRKSLPRSQQKHIQENITKKHRRELHFASAAYVIQQLLTKVNVQLLATTIESTVLTNGSYRVYPQAGA